MKRNIITLLLTLVLTLAFSVNCFALPSPTEPVIPTETTKRTLTIAPAAYGSNDPGVWEKGCTEGLPFDIDPEVGADAKFYVDGKLLASSDYTLNADGKTITLSTHFLSKLAAGSHTLKVEDTDGLTDSTTFTVVAEKSDSKPDDDLTIKPSKDDGKKLGVWGRGETTGLSFTLNPKVDVNAKFYIDGKLLDPSMYTISANGKIITLSASCLAQLSLGTHTLKVVDADGKVSSTTFTTNDKEEQPNTNEVSPQTADNNNYALIISLILLSGVCLGAMVLNKKKAIQ